MVSINNKSNRSNSSSDHLSIIFSTFSFLETYVFTGVCLTVTQFDKSSFKVGVAPETLRRTNFHELQVGMGVNCERAMKGDKRFGGHAVQVSFTERAKGNDKADKKVMGKEATPSSKGFDTLRPFFSLRSLKSEREDLSRSLLEEKRKGEPNFESVRSFNLVF